MTHTGTQNWIRHRADGNYEVQCKNNSELIFIVNAEQLKKIRKYTWTTHPAGSQNIVVRPTVNGKQKVIHLTDMLGIEKKVKFKDKNRFNFTPENIIRPNDKEYNFKKYENAIIW